ncbi:MAG: rRNA maturation RNase YbeY [Planctomycetota bacterium]
MDEPSQPDRPPSAGPAIHVQWITGSAHAAELEPLIGTLAASLAPRTGEARVRVVDDTEMKGAHERYKNVPGTTDVLTFDLAGNPNQPLDADVLVCVDEAERQADERGIPVAHELLLYITHAILHCSGYNDDTDANAAVMHAREDELLTAVGIGPVYAASPERAR